ncbi:MFS transporter [Streptomyces sp. NPDC020607]|uniref:MFS transporter n=1 Tax=Streptomyces sp. NPDC020607 TaxID=3365082 RepID=UPI0037AE722B
MAARVLQGGGAAVMIPQVLATLHVTFDGRQRSRAFGLYGAVLSFGSVLGPVLGGVLTEADLFGLGWRPAFLINVPIGLAVFLLGQKFVRESTAEQAQRLDLTGMPLSALALLLIVFPLTEGHAPDALRHLLGEFVDELPHTTSGAGPDRRPGGGRRTAAVE